MIATLKIIFLLGFLIIIHELGHFIVAKLCKVKVLEFSIGFGTVLWSKQGKETKYSFRLIPLGGFVNMLGEEEKSNESGSFSKTKIWKRILIVAAGGFVNIIFGIILYFILTFIVYKTSNYENSLLIAFSQVGRFIMEVFNSLKMLFIGGVDINQFVGLVGVSEIIAQSAGLINYLLLMAAISISLGVTNLLPFIPLDGGKIVLLIIEKIRNKPLSEKFESYLNLVGLGLIIFLSLYVTYNDIINL